MGGMGDDGRTVRLAFDVGGRDGGGLVVLLNGLGATAGVWTPLTARLGCRWLALDLPGHGGSARLASYDLETYAAALIPAIVDRARGAPTTLVGHSLGGSVVLAIAASACGGWAPARAFALGVKIDWSEAELARFAALAERPPRRFGTPDEALVQHSRLSGLEGVEVDSPLLRRGITKDGEGWQVAMDNRAFAVEPPPVERMLAEACCPVHLACGADDPMIGLDRLRQFDPSAIAFRGAGHNAMVDAPEAIAGWLEQSRPG